jgi:hypothetical protein
MNGWLDFETTDHDDGSITLTATPKRFYWLHLSFWVMVIRSRSLMPTARDLDE